MAVLWVKSLHINIVSLKNEDTISGITQKRSHWLLLNHIIIAGKQVIYPNRLKNSVPLLSHLVVRLKYIPVESIEQAIAIKNNRLKFHKRKWKCFLSYLELRKNLFQKNLLLETLYFVSKTDR